MGANGAAGNGFDARAVERMICAARGRRWQLLEAMAQAMERRRSLVEVELVSCLLAAPAWGLALAEAVAGGAGEKAGEAAREAAGDVLACVRRADLRVMVDALVRARHRGRATALRFVRWRLRREKFWDVRGPWFERRLSWNASALTDLANAYAAPLQMTALARELIELEQRRLLAGRCYWRMAALLSGEGIHSQHAPPRTPAPDAAQNAGPNNGTHGTQAREGGGR